MGQILSIDKQTENRFLNMYHIKARSVHDTPVHYFIASRSEKIDDLKVKTGENHPDGVAIYSLYGEKRDKVVLIRQYRYSIGNYIYEFPAGLVEPGEAYRDAAVREMKEETGLTLTPLTADDIYQRPYFTTIGMTDESCATVYGYADGEPSELLEEATEEISVVFADRKEICRILREENVSLICAFMLMHFLSEKEPFAFLTQETEE